MDYLKVDEKSLGDFLELFGMERNDLPLLGVTEINIPSFGVNEMVYFLVYTKGGKMDYAGFHREEARTVLGPYNSINYYEGEINTNLSTGFLLKIGEMKYRALTQKERKEIEKILRKN